jgi:CxxC motif-containing protein (DUF1111 family)
MTLSITPEVLELLAARAAFSSPPPENSPIGGTVMRRARTFAILAAAGAVYVVCLGGAVRGDSDPTEAPTGFSPQSNGFAEEFCSRQQTLVNSSNSPMIPPSQCKFSTAAEEFSESEDTEEGLGPVFNATGCGECHGTPALGGGSQITEKRAGFFDGQRFSDHPGGSLIHDRAVDPAIQEHVLDDHYNVIAFRASLSLFGDGFVEAIDSQTLSAIAASQSISERGQLIDVPVLEAPGHTRTGRFGWKAQQASLVSFSADAYVNEMGVTSPLQPVENTANGEDISIYDGVPDPDDEGVSVELFALFMRSLKAPPVDAARAATSNARTGRDLFERVGCNSCHRTRIVTAPVGTLINGGALKVTNALGNKIIHPFSDFLLHDIGTGDGIVQNGGASTRNKVRTAALWGLRARGRFMHDANSLSVEDAIARHAGQATTSRRNFDALRRSDRNKVIEFLMSL